MYIFGVTAVRIFPHSDWTRRDIFPYSVRIREKANQNISEYGHFYAVSRNNVAVLMKPAFYVRNLTPCIVNTKYKISMSAHCIFYKQANPFRNLFTNRESPFLFVNITLQRSFFVSLFLLVALPSILVCSL